MWSTRCSASGCPLANKHKGRYELAGGKGPMSDGSFANCPPPPAKARKTSSVSSSASADVPGELTPEEKVSGARKEGRRFCRIAPDVARKKR